MTISASLDKPGGYAPGDTITLTVVSDKRLSSTSLAISAAGEGAQSTLIVQLGVLVTDPSGRKWTVKSDDGKTQVLTSTA